MDSSNVPETLRHLVEHDVVRGSHSQPPTYEFKVEPVRLWPERNRALGRMVEDVEDRITFSS